MLGIAAILKAGDFVGYAVSAIGALTVLSVVLCAKHINQGTGRVYEILRWCIVLAVVFDVYTSLAGSIAYVMKVPLTTVIKVVWSSMLQSDSQQVMVVLILTFIMCGAPLALAFLYDDYTGGDADSAEEETPAPTKRAAPRRPMGSRSESQSSREVGSPIPSLAGALIVILAGIGGLVWLHYNPLWEKNTGNASVPLSDDERQRDILEEQRAKAKAIAEPITFATLAAEAETKTTVNAVFARYLGRKTNSLGMVFTPVPGAKVLFSIWETRVQDFQLFAQETGLNWNAWQIGNFKQDPNHPAVNLL